MESIPESISLPQNLVCNIPDPNETNNETSCKSVIDCCAKVIDYNNKVIQYNKEQDAVYDTSYSTWINRKRYINNVKVAKWHIDRDNYEYIVRTERVKGTCQSNMDCKNSKCPDNWEKDKSQEEGIGFDKCDVCMGNVCNKTGCHANCRKKEVIVHNEMRSWDEKNPKPIFNEPEPKRTDYHNLRQKLIKWNVNIQ